MSSTLHQQGHRIPSPELARELRSMLGTDVREKALLFDTKMMQTLHDADPASFVEFLGRHRKELDAHQAIARRVASEAAVAKNLEDFHGRAPKD